MPMSPLYPPKCFTFNDPKYPHGVLVDCDLYTEAMRTKKVGNTITHEVGAPWAGFITYRITKMDATGVYADVICDTSYVLDPEDYV